MVAEEEEDEDEEEEEEEKVFQGESDHDGRQGNKKDLWPFDFLLCALFGWDQGQHKRPKARILYRQVGSGTVIV